MLPYWYSTVQAKTPLNTGDEEDDVGIQASNIAEVRGLIAPLLRSASRSALVITDPECLEGDAGPMWRSFGQQTSAAKKSQNQATSLRGAKESPTRNLQPALQGWNFPPTS